MPPADRVQERTSTHPSVAAVWSVAPGPEAHPVIAADGCFDLIVTTGPTGRSCAFIYRPEARAHVARIERGCSLVGVRLRPGHGAVLARHGDAVVQTALRWLDEGHDPGDLESLVTAAVDDLGRPPRVLVAFVAQAVAQAGQVRLTTATSTAVERERQRASRDWLGVTPKAFLRIERARAARAAIRRGLPLAAIAADLGYADQAHLTRELRDLAGTTPRHLRPVGILQDHSSRRS